MEFPPIWTRTQRSLFPRIEDQIRQSHRGTGRSARLVPIARAFVVATARS